MNVNPVMTSQPAEYVISPKREVALREMLSLVKMASAIAVPSLLIALIWL